MQNLHTHENLDKIQRKFKLNNRWFVQRRDNGEDDDGSYILEVEIKYYISLPLSTMGTIPPPNLNSDEYVHICAHTQIV